MTNTAPMYPGNMNPRIPRDFKVAPLGTESRRERRKAWRDGPMTEGINFRSSGFCVQPRLTAEVI